MSLDELDPVSLANIQRILDRLNQLPAAVGAAGVEQASNYLLNVLVRKEIPPYRYVSRTEAYGQPFKSARQRGWFFWALHTGRINIPYQRRSPNAGLATSWEIIGSGLERGLRSRMPEAYWIYSQRQARQLGLVGWKKMSTILELYEDRILASFMRGVRSAIQRLGLQ